MTLKDETFIHVGIIKTGTTFLQREIFPNLELHYYHKPDLLRTDFRDGKKLLSREDWSHIPYNPNKPELFDYNYVILHRLKQLFPNAKLIVGIRDKGFVKSLYSRFLLAGCSLSYKEFNHRLNPKFIDYTNYLSVCKELFDEVFVYNFEDLKYNKKHLIRDLCEFMNVPILTEYMNKNYNVKLSGHKKFLLRLLNMTRWFKIPGINNFFNRYIRK